VRFIRQGTFYTRVNIETQSDRMRTGTRDSVCIKTESTVCKRVCLSKTVVTYGFEICIYIHIHTQCNCDGTYLNETLLQYQYCSKGIAVSLLS